MTMRTAVTVMAVLCAGATSLAKLQQTPRTVAHAPGMPEALTYEAGASAPNSARLLTSGSETKGAWSLVDLREKRMSELRTQHGTEELGTWDPR